MTPTEPTGPGDAAPDSPAPVRWSVGEALVAGLIGFFVATLAGSLFPSTTNRIPVGALVATEIGLWVGFVGGPLWCSRTRGTGSLRHDFGLWARRGDGPVGVIAGVAAQFLLGVVLYLPLRALDPSAYNRLGQPAQRLTGAGHGWTMPIVVLIVVIGAPVAEELFFRGLLLRALAGRVGNGRAVVISALLFGLAHGELLQLPALVVFGVLLGLLAVRTGRLGPGVFAHAGFNAVTVAVLLTAR